MSAQHIAVWALLGAAAVVVVLSGVGLLGARDSIPRLHFITPVTSVAAPLTGVAYAVQEGWGISAGLVLLIVGLISLTGPGLGAAIGRAAAFNEGKLPRRSSS